MEFFSFSFFFVIILSTSCFSPHMTPARLVWERASLLATLVSMATASAERRWRRRREFVVREGKKDGVFRVCEAVGDARRHVSLSRLSPPNRPPATPAVSQLRWPRTLIRVHPRARWLLDCHFSSRYMETPTRVYRHMLRHSLFSSTVSRSGRIPPNVTMETQHLVRAICLREHKRLSSTWLRPTLV